MATLFMTAKAVFDIQTLVNLCPMEIGFWGRVRMEGKSFCVWEILVSEQTVGPTHVAGGDGMTKLCQELADISDINFFGHSHVNMPCFFSGPDQQMLDLFEDFNMPFAISAVFNKQSKYKATAKIFQYEGAVIPSFKIKILEDDKWEDLRARKEELRAILDAKVHQIAPPPIRIYEEVFQTPHSNWGLPITRFIPRSQFPPSISWLYKGLECFTEDIPLLEKSEGIYVYGAMGRVLEFFHNESPIKKTKPKQEETKQEETKQEETKQEETKQEEEKPKQGDKNE